MPRTINGRVALSLLLSIALLLPLFGSGVANAQDNAQDQEADARVLVFSKTAGFRHGSIETGIAAIEQLGVDNGFAVDATEDATAFNDENLSQYDAVIWLSTTGDVLDAEQEAAFERYIQGGGGYAGIHAASDTEYGWEWYGDLVGAYFASHPQNQDATVKVADQAHPSTEGLPERWERHDEWYNFQSNPRGDVHVLATLDESTYNAGGGAMGLDHPTAWCHVYDGGRAWYTGGGHTNASFSEDLFLQHILGGIQWAAGLLPGDCGATEWENYQKVALDTGTENPMELDIAPDGRVFYIERDGRLRIIDPATNTTSTAGALNVYTGQEDGLVGLTLDPNFADNNWVYLFYAPAGTEPKQHVSRFTMDGDTLDLTSEEVLLEIPVQRDECCHAGGSLVFDPAGNLYISVGDDTNPFASSGYTPIDERDGRSAWDAQRTSGNTNDLRGKILRITPQADGSYTIPEGNLFAPGTELTQPEIYAMGFRNPFRIGMDPESGKLFVADYGPDAGSANPDRGPEGRVEWNIVDEPGNYGWPYCHGNAAYHDYDFATNTSGALFDCAGGPVNDSPNNTGLTQLPPVIEPDVYYGRSSQGTNLPELGTGGAPMAGPVYRFDETLDSDRQWPEYYDGAAMFYEWGSNQLWEFQLDGDWDVLEANRVLPDETFLRPMDMDFGPDGAMYLIEWGSGFGGNNADSGIYRIDYTGAQQNPVARAAADPASGPAPLTVQFSSAGSGHPQGLSLDYAWDFGDGNTSTEANPAHTYAEPGNYTAVLVVTDSEGRTATANVEVVVGNTAPEVTIEFPVDGGFFTFGDQIRYEITVTDAEEGSTEDGGIDCADVRLQSSLGHASHAHPIEVLEGCEGLLQTSGDDGHADTEELFWVLEASYTDAGGEGGAGELSGRDLIILNPKRIQSEHFDATGRTADGQGGGTPGVQTETTGDTQGGAQNIGWIEDGDWVSYGPVNLLDIEQVRFRVASAGAGGTIELRKDASDGELLGSVGVTPTGNWQSYVNVTADVADPGDTFDLYVVARRPEGSTSTGGLFNINWMDFLGRGVSDNSAPIVEASASPLKGEAPLTVDFTGSATDPDGDPVTLEWDFGDGNTAAGADATHTYASAGDYTATLTATDDKGAVGRATVDVTVDPVSLPPISCLGERSDFFEGDSLDKDRWSKIVREDPSGYRVEDGNLILPTTTTDIYGSGGNTPNIILQPLPDGAWEATAKLTLEARDAYQQAGLVVYGDDDNYAKMVIQARGTSSASARIFQFIREENGAPNEVGDSNTAQLGADYPDTVWVRFSSNGADLRASYSADGITWTEMPQTKQMAGIQNPHIGLMALAGSGDRPVIDAHFDWFQIQPDPTAERPELRSDEFTGEQLDGCRWDRIEALDESKLALDGENLRIETVPGDIYSTGNSGKANFILQTPPEGDWVIETKFDEELAGSYQQAGLMVYVDDDNYVKFDVISDQGQSDANRAELRSEIGGSVQNPQPNINPLPSNDGTWWLRLEKSGDTFSGSLSADGHVWHDMPQSVSNPVAAADGAFGIYTLGVNQTTATTVVFDYFRVLGEEEPEVPATPTATLDPADPDGEDGWYVSPVTLTLTSDDPEAEIELDLGEGWNPFDGPLVFDADGAYSVSFRASNTAGTSEEGTVEFDIDRTAPATGHLLAGAREGEIFTEPVTVTLEAEDATSGVAETHYRMAGASEHTVYTEPFAVEGDGEHTLEYRSVDVAGNVEDWQSVTFTINTGPCPNPDQRETVVIGGVDSGVANRPNADGCTINDLIDEEGPWDDHGQFVEHVNEVTDQLHSEGVIDGRERGMIVRAAARSDVGQAVGVAR